MLKIINGVKKSSIMVKENIEDIDRKSGMFGNEKITDDEKTVDDVKKIINDVRKNIGDVDRRVTRWFGIRDKNFE
jgi:hypothetical protein